MGDSRSPGKRKTNLQPVLSHLEDEMELSDPLELSWQDIINLHNLEIKFHEPKGPLSQYIQNQFKSDTIQLLNSSFPNSYSSAYAYFDLDKILNNKILNELNRLLNDPNLFEEKRFEHVAINEKIRKMIDNKPEGKDLRYLNRLLLEEAYPKEIAKSADSIVCKRFRKTTKPDSSQPKHLEIPYFLTLNHLVLEYITSNLFSTRPKYKLVNVDKLRELLQQVKSHQITREEEKLAWKSIKDQILR